MFPFRAIFCTLLSLIEIWGQLSSFTITIYDAFMTIYEKRGLTVGIFDISTFSMTLCFFLLHLMKVFPTTQNFFGKKYCLALLNRG